MCNISKIYFLQKYFDLFFNKNLSKRLVILFFVCILQHISVAYAMEETEELAEQQSTRRSVVKSKGEDLNTYSYENEETKPLLPIKIERNKHWKQNWFVKNIIVEFPIIGDFFHHDLSTLESIKRAGKSAFMLAGGSAGMMLDIIPPATNDNMAVHITKGSINMAIGMWVAATGYNIVWSLGEIAYQCLLTPHQSSQYTPTL